MENLTQRLARNSESRGWRWVETERPEERREEGPRIHYADLLAQWSAWQAASIVAMAELRHFRDQRHRFALPLPTQHSWKARQ